MFAASPFAANAWASSPGGGFREFAEGNGALGTKLLLTGVSQFIRNSSGALGTKFLLNGVSQRIASGTGALGTSFQTYGQISIVFQSGGLMGTRLDFKGVGAIYEFPHIPQDERIIKVGPYFFQWRPELGKWRPMAIPDPADNQERIVSDNQNITDSVSISAVTVGFAEVQDVSDEQSFIASVPVQADTQAVTDAQVIDVAMPAQADTQGTTDQIDYFMEEAPVFIADTQGTTDSISMEFSSETSLYFELLDAQEVTDEVSYSTSVGESQSYQQDDIQAVIDNAIVTALSDTVAEAQPTVDDVVPTAISDAPADSQGVVETIGIAVSVGFSDTQDITDEVNYEVFEAPAGLQQDDTQATTDALSVAVATAQDDTQAQADDIAIGLDYGSTDDTQATTDAVGIAISYAVDDTQAQADAQALGVSLSVADTQASADGQGSAVSVGVADTQATADNVSNQQTVPVTDGMDYSKLVIALRFDNVGSSTVIDEKNGSTAWTLEGGATQSASGAIAGAGSLDLRNNSGGKYLVSTNAAVLEALHFPEAEAADASDWCMRFKYTPREWVDAYACVLGSGPGRPVVTFSNFGIEFSAKAAGGAGAIVNGGDPLPLGITYEFLVGRSEGRIYYFLNGTLLNPGGDVSTGEWPLQDEWRIGTQSHAPECLDGVLDDFQVFRGFGGPTSNYVASPSTPFPIA